MFMRIDTPPLTDTSAMSGVASLPRDYDPHRVLTIDQLAVFDILVHPLWIFDFVERRMRWANKAGLDMWNAKSLDELLSRTYQDMSAATVKRLEALLIECEKGWNISDEWTLYPNGIAKTVHMNVSGLKLSSDEDHVCIVFEGIPYVKEELEHSKTRGVEMLRHLPLAVCQFDMQGHVMYQNPEALLTAEMTEHDIEPEEEHEPSNKGPERFDHDGCPKISSRNSSSTTTAPSASALTRRSEAGGLLNRFEDPLVGQKVLREIQSQDSCDLEAVIKTRNGPKSCVVQLRKARDPVTAEDVILFSARDNSDAHRAEKERKAREEKSEFFAIMAHEIRTPLHQVTGFIDLLDQTCLNKEQKSFVNLLKTAAKGLMTVISDVLDFSKLEAGKMKLESIPYQPLSVVQGSIEAVQQSCDERNLYLDLQWDNSIPFIIKGDPNRVRQIMLNLLSNAIKFTKEGSICVQGIPVGGDQPMVKFIVKDTGVGLAEEHQSTIFLKYQQANASVTRQYGGTGLGLSICQLLVKGMGGSIGVESELGKGSSFWFTIPAELPADEGEVDVNEDDPAMDSTSLHILVAEDNKVNQKLVVHMLKRFGHTCDVADNGKIAVEMVQDGHYDCCLMDIQMPTMDGLEATKTLRSMGYTDLPIYGLTASVARSDFRELGFNAWITKPVPMKDIKAKLRQIKNC
ncbi:hypothetical protein ACA910_009011 [Epithemia clementina (nom. ined.)]